jgi:hypothetical protein
MLVKAMNYLAKADPIANRSAVELLSEHVRTRLAAQLRISFSAWLSLPASNKDASTMIAG